MSEDLGGEAVEVALEAVEDEVQGGREGQPVWFERAALGIMVMALFTAVGGLLSGITANEAIIDRQKAIGELIERNRTDLKAEVLLTRIDLIELMGREPDPSMLEEVAAAYEVGDRFTEEASEHVAGGAAALREHELFAIGTMLLSVAITLSGMAVVVRIKYVWSGALGLGVIGAGVVVYGIVRLFH